MWKEPERNNARLFLTNTWRSRVQTVTNVDDGLMKMICMEFVTIFGIFFFFLLLLIFEVVWMHRVTGALPQMNTKWIGKILVVVFFFLFWMRLNWLACVCVWLRNNDANVHRTFIIIIFTMISSSFENEFIYLVCETYTAMRLCLSIADIE